MGKREIDTRFKRDIYELITLKNLSLHSWQDPSKEFSLGMKGRRYKSLQVSTCLEEFAPRTNKRTGFRYVCRKKKKAVLSLFRFFPMKKKSRRIRKNFESLAASRRLEGILFFQPQRDSYGVFVTKRGCSTRAKSLWKFPWREQGELFHRYLRFTFSRKKYQPRDGFYN